MRTNKKSHTPIPGAQTERDPSDPFYPLPGKRTWGRTIVAIALLILALLTFFVLGQVHF
jgi:hypothetical protein